MKASCGISPLFRSDHQLGADILLKRFALDQLLRANGQDEGTLERTEHTADLVDTDVALLGSLLGGEGQLEVNGNSFDLIVFHGFDSFNQSKDVDGLNRFFRGQVPLSFSFSFASRFAQSVRYTLDCDTVTFVLVYWEMRKTT